MQQAELAATPLTGARPERAPPIWTFIAFDCTSFGIFFVVFMVQRLGQSELFDRSSQLLNSGLGFLNACILITSSWLIAWANIAGKRGRLDEARRLLWAGIGVAACFGVVKMYEYYEKISSGITVSTNEFFTFYFALTGVHFLHYLIGMVVLVALTRGPSPFGTREESQASYAKWLEGGSLYWHMVDLLWIFIFSLLYLIGAR